MRSVQEPVDEYIDDSLLAADEQLTLQLLRMLTVMVAMSQEARDAAGQRDSGILAALQLATSAPTPLFQTDSPVAAAAAAVKEDSATSDNEKLHAGVAAAAAELMVQLVECSQARRCIAKPLAQVSDPSGW